MRAFLVLIFLFTSSLALRKFEEWLYRLRTGKFRPDESHQFEVIETHKTGNGADRDIVFKFSLKHLPQWWLVADVKYRGGDVYCHLVPNEWKMNEDLRQEKQELKKLETRLNPLIQELMLTDQTLHIITNQLMDWKWKHKDLNQKVSSIGRLHTARRLERQQYVNQANAMMQKIKVLEEEYKVTEAKKMDIEAKLSPFRELKDQFDEKEAEFESMSNMKVEFQFDPIENRGHIELVQASKYLLYGDNPPDTGFGTIVMRHVMALFDAWIDRHRRGELTLSDLSNKYVDGAFWDPLSALSSFRSRRLLICCEYRKKWSSISQYTVSIINLINLFSCYFSLTTFTESTFQLLDSLSLSYPSIWHY